MDHRGTAVGSVPILKMMFVPMNVFHGIDVPMKMSMAGMCMTVTLGML
jgi:hypothetical protein